MEFEKFEAIRLHFCDHYKDVTEGKMMSSPAIHFKGKVFAFFSSKKKMVFKLGDAVSSKGLEEGMVAFSPFKKQKTSKRLVRGGL